MNHKFRIVAFNNGCYRVDIKFWFLPLIWFQVADINWIDYRSPWGVIGGKNHFLDEQAAVNYMLKVKDGLERERAKKAGKKWSSKQEFTWDDLDDIRLRQRLGFDTKQRNAK